MTIPENVIYILQKLEKTGFNSYIVGGCVRDSIMGNVPKDWDIATAATPEEVKVLFAKTYDTGLKHGTVTVVLNEDRYEVTTFRVDGEYKDYRRPEAVVYSKSIQDDLRRRDFTINAIAFNLSEGLVDPFGGINDIRERLIKGVGSPSERFREDALRMLRAVRFAAKLGFTLDKNTFDAVIENSALIKNISVERIQNELLELLTAQNLDIVFSKAFTSLMEHISRPLAESIVENQDSLARLLKDCKNDPALRFATLIYFIEHTDAKKLLKKLKLSNKMYNRIIAVHRIKDEKIHCEYSDVVSKIYEWGFQAFEDYLYLHMLDCVANGADLDYVLQLEESYRLIVDNNFPVFVKDLAVNGYDLNVEFKITGRTIGKTLDSLLDFVHNNPCKNTYEELLSEAYNLIVNI